jgi:hypothetical protein
MEQLMENKTKDFLKYFEGNDLRSPGKSEGIIPLIKNQNDFDELFIYLNNNDRNTRMKAIDVVEKITSEDIEFLQKHKNKIMELCKEKYIHIEFNWNLAQLLGRLDFTGNETDDARKILKEWIVNKTESRIVRANSLESYYGLVKTDNKLEKEFNEMAKEIMKENIPSIKARLKKIELKERRK